MTARTGCLPDEDLVNALLDESADRSSGLADHRLQCDRCEARARSWEATFGLLATDPLAGDVPAPDGLHASIMEAVSRAPLLVTPAAGGGLAQRLRSILQRPLNTAWAGLAATALLVVIAVVGVRGPSRPIGNLGGHVETSADRTSDAVSSDLAALGDESILDLSWTPELEGDDALAAASALTNEQADWVVRELARRLGG